MLSPIHAIAGMISTNRARMPADPSAEKRAEFTDYVDWAEQDVAGCRGGSIALERMFDDTAKLARSRP